MSGITNSVDYDQNHKNWFNNEASLKGVRGGLAWNQLRCQIQQWRMALTRDFKETVLARVKRDPDLPVPC